jgi:aminoglycoside phosphotransferase (APT) family kinase protein
MSIMNAEQLEDWLNQHLPQQVPPNIFKSQNINVKHVFNWGGFVNQSFAISDGADRYHLKITNTVDHISRLERWLKFHDVLELRYRTPKLVAWVDFPKIGFAGLLMEHVDGTNAKLLEHPDLVQQLIEFVRRLHSDVEIQSRLSTTENSKTYCDYFIETYIDRFTADLATIAQNPPPFISDSLLVWMSNETEHLRRRAISTQAFNAAARAPVHGDLHEGNILVTANEWFVVDWDDLSLGDPAVEFAVLFWPLMYKGLDWRTLLTADDSFTERIELCLRAQLLDEVIDTVADYVEAGIVPSKQVETRLAKKLRHEEALEKYRITASAGG